MKKDFGESFLISLKRFRAEGLGKGFSLNLTLKTILFYQKIIVYYSKGMFHDVNINIFMSRMGYDNGEIRN